MIRRIAHRPRYNQAQRLPHLSQRMQKDFLRDRWTYRRFAFTYQKRQLGQGLLQVPFGYRFFHGLAFRS